MHPDTRFAVIGANKTTYSNVLPGYRKIGLNIVEDAEAKVEGVTFEVTNEELKKLDRYEGVAQGLYKLIDIVLESGEEAKVYVKCNPEAVVFTGNTIG